MNKKEIIEKYPNLFIPNCSRIECEEGWMGILDNFCQKLSELSNNVHLIQVKEKFGSLTINLDSYSDKAVDLLNEASFQSSMVCEKCGSKDKVTTAGIDDTVAFSWVKTFCQSCREKSKIE